MVENKSSLVQKCGDIFVNIKTIKNKAKMFTFHCTLCSVDCDQLKKFSNHLEDHLVYFENLLKNPAVDNDIYFEKDEIKIEMPEKLSDMDENNVTGGHALSLAYDDPLQTDKFYKAEMVVSSNIKEENQHDLEHCDKKPTKGDPEDDEINPKMFLNFNYFSSDESLDLSSDSELEKELKSPTNNKKSENSVKNIKTVVLKRTKKSSDKASDKDAEKNKPKKRTRIIESILPFLIAEYKKYEILWQIDDIAFGIKVKIYEIYAKIAEALKQDEDIVISLEDLSYHINYLNELYSKDKEQELKCKMKGKDFTPAFELYKEMEFLSQSQGPFLCPVCNEVLARYHLYCQHMAEHNDTLPYKCPLCDSSFVSYHKFLVHKKRHLGILDFHCKICGKGYMFKNDLEWHVTSHTGDKPYLCPICGTGFRARHGYDNHVRRHEERFRHECHICKRGFNQLHALNSHVKSHLNIRDVICNICGKGFVHTKYLRRHELIHGTEKRYKCNECGKDFFQSCGLRAHRKNHHARGSV